MSDLIIIVGCVALGAIIGTAVIVLGLFFYSLIN